MSDLPAAMVTSGRRPFQKRECRKIYFMQISASRIWGKRENIAIWQNDKNRQADN